MRPATGVLVERPLARSVANAALPERTSVQWLYGVLGVGIFAYLVALLLQLSGAFSLTLESSFANGIEFAGGVLCLARALGPKPGRLIALVLGCALLFWCAGDSLATASSAMGSARPFLADILTFGFYPFALAAGVLFICGEARSLARPNWVDGAIAGLGAAAVCAAFAFHRILDQTGGRAAERVLGLAFPIGDVILFGLVVGGTAVLAGRRRMAWLLLAAGMALYALGDTSRLFSATFSGSQTATVFNSIAWPVASVMFAMAVWVRPRPASPLAPRRVSSFVLPELGGLSSLAVLLGGSVTHENRVALGLATAALLLAGARVAVSARGLKATNQERRHQSVTDELTGLGNRRHLIDTLKTFFAAEVDESRPRMLAFLFVDLNHFKEINDSFGHPAGDDLLRQLGPRLKQAIGDADLAVRLGGDEFAIILSDCDIDYTLTIARRLSMRIREPFRLGSVNAGISASIGIATAPNHADDIDGLIACADVAMYRAKLSNISFAIFTPELDYRGNRLGLAEELRQAVHGGQLVLHYQPQVELSRGQIVGVEALLRWKHPQLGVLAPLNFLPLAEEAGMMRVITKFVLDEALRQCAEWRSGGNNMIVSVNVSATNLLDAGFTELVEDLLELHGLGGEALVVEITETTVTSEFEKSRMVIERLRALGLTVSIDDFGAGFTSLVYLNSLEIGELKLDRTFISTLASHNHERDGMLVRATIDLGHALGLEIVAEGIEDGPTLELLTAFGCDRAQGDFIGKPVSADQLQLDVPALAAKQHTSPRLLPTVVGELGLAQAP